MAEYLILIAIMTATNTFWLFAIVWENKQRRKEVYPEG